MYFKFKPKLIFYFLMIYNVDIYQKTQKKQNNYKICNKIFQNFLIYIEI